MSEENRVQLNCFNFFTIRFNKATKANCVKVHGQSTIMIFLRLVTLGIHGLNGLTSSVTASLKARIHFLSKCEHNPVTSKATIESTIQLIKTGVLLDAIKI